MSRSTEEVIAHHLGAFAEGLDSLMSDFDKDAVLFEGAKTYRGLGEIGGFFSSFLAGATPEFWNAFRIETKAIGGDVAYLVWEAKPAIAKAADTFLIRDGKILVQTVTLFAP